MLYPKQLDLDAIAANYPDRAILEVDGQVQRWLEVRLSQLLTKSRHLSFYCDGTKTLGLTVGVLGAICASSTLFGGLAAAFGIVGWANAVLKDQSKTRSLHPFPFVRKDISNWIQDISDPDLRMVRESFLAAQGVSEFHQKTIEMLSYLDVEEFAEAKLLVLYFDKVSAILQSVNQQRIKFLLYLRIIDFYIKNDSLSMTEEDVESAIQGAKSDYSIDYGSLDRLNHLTESQSYGRLPQPEWTPIAEASIPTTPRRRVELDLPAPPREDRPVHQSNDRVVLPEPSTDRRAMNPPMVERAPRNLDKLVQNSIASTRRTEGEQALDVIKRYAGMRQNLLLLSVGGGGKGIFLSNFFRFRSELDPSFVAFWVDPKNEPGESGYFEHESIAKYRFNSLANVCNKEELADHVRTAMQSFRSLMGNLPPKTPNWLCFDEWTTIQMRLKNTPMIGEVNDYIASAVSLLDGINSHILLVGQSPKLSDIMPDGGGILANFSKIILFKREERSFGMMEKCQQCGVMPKSLSQEDLFSACDRSPVSRAIYIDGKLLPMPKLTNYSDYDRDTNTVLRKEEVTDVTLP